MNNRQTAQNSNKILLFILLGCASTASSATGLPMSTDAVLARGVGLGHVPRPRGAPKSRPLTPVSYDEILNRPSSDDGEYQKYFDIIREKITKTAQEDLRWADREGIVKVSFGLTSTGKLTVVNVLEDKSTADKKLFILAKSAVKKLRRSRLFLNICKNIRNCSLLSS